MNCLFFIFLFIDLFHLTDQQKKPLLERDKESICLNIQRCKNLYCIFFDAEEIF